MKKKLISILCACLMLVCSLAVLTGCSSSSSSNKLIVGFDAEYPPYGYLAVNGEDGYESADGQTYTGFDLDLASEVCARNGWELEVKPIDWDSKDALLGSGDIDCIWNGFTIEGREGKYAFTDAYMINGQVIVTRADSNIKTFDDLAGKIVMTQKGSAALTALEEDDLADLTASFKSLQTIDSYNNAFMQLESGAVDAVACDLSIAAYQISAKPDVFYQLGEYLSLEHYGVGFANNDKDRAQTVTDTLKEMGADGTVKALCEKYADQGMDYSNWCLGNVTIENTGSSANNVDMGLIFSTLINGLGMTLQIFIITLIGALPLGIIIALARLSKFKPLSWLARFYISILRGTPLMLQLMAWMFVPYYVFGVSMGPDWKFIACCIGFILNYSAYFGEIYRSGIQSIPKGQYEAAEILGYTKAQCFIKIILPQVIKRIIPAMGNEIIALIKDTSLAFVLGIMEMFTQAKALAAAMVSMVPYAVAAVIYWCFTLGIEALINFVEKKLNYYRD